VGIDDVEIFLFVVFAGVDFEVVAEVAVGDVVEGGVEGLKVLADGGLLGGDVRLAEFGDGAQELGHGVVYKGVGWFRLFIKWGGFN